MATKGRKPKPTHLKLLAGNPGKRPINLTEARVDLDQPSPPPFLCDEAKVEWGRVVSTLYECGLMTQIDRGALAAYCQAYGRWQQAEQALAEMAKKDPTTRGLLIRTKNGNAIQNPLVGVANKAHADVVRYAVEFGMTPSSRSRVIVSPEKPGNRFANNGAKA